MTFDKYDGKHDNNPFATTVFPHDGHEYDYKIVKDIGWCQIKGEKLEDLPEQEWDIKIPKEVKMENKIKMQDVKDIDMEGEADNIGFITTNDGDLIYFHIISKKEYNNIVFEEMDRIGKEWKKK